MFVRAQFQRLSNDYLLRRRCKSALLRKGLTLSGNLQKTNLKYLGKNHFKNPSINKSKIIELNYGKRRNW